MFRIAGSIGLAMVALVAVGRLGSADQADPELRPWLGISYSPDGDVGIVVTNVFEESAALACGLRIGDEIVDVDGQITPPGSDLTAVIGPHDIGDRLVIRVRRGDRMLTLYPVLSRRLSDAELLHVQLVGRRAPAFTLIPPDARTLAPINDTILAGKVGILAWFHTSCARCPAAVNKMVPWMDAHRGVVGLAGMGGSPTASVEDIVSAARAMLKSTPILLPVGVDQDAWQKYGVLVDPRDRLALIVVDRQGVVQLAAAIDVSSAEDQVFDDAFAAAERALRQKKARF